MYFYSCSCSVMFTYHMDTDNKTSFVPLLVLSSTLMRGPSKQINGEDKQHVSHALLKDYGETFVSSLRMLAKQPCLLVQHILGIDFLDSKC